MDRDKLLGAIRARGLTQACVAEALGISLNGFWRKTKERNDFTLPEIRKMEDLLELTPSQVRAIFFAETLE